VWRCLRGVLGSDEDVELFGVPGELWAQVGVQLDVEIGLWCGEGRREREREGAIEFELKQAYEGGPREHITHLLHALVDKDGINTLDFHIDRGKALGMKEIGERHETGENRQRGDRQREDTGCTLDEAMHIDRSVI
jgi:hypothetical protein